MAEHGDGAEYHENQKTAEGQRSKRNDMPDFTIIGEKETARIENDIRSKYADVETIDMFKTEEEKNAYLKRIDAYRNSFTTLSEDQKELLESVYGITYINQQVIDDLVKISEKNEREKIIQDECERIIFSETVKKAISPDFEKEIKENILMKKEYNNIKSELRKKYVNTDKNIKQKIEIEAKTKLLFRKKAKEILDFAKINIPTFFEATIPKDFTESPVVYRYTPGECIYRNYYNRLKGLKTSDGREIYKPQPQQERALLKLVDLFDENYAEILDINFENEHDEKSL